MAWLVKVEVGGDTCFSREQVKLWKEYLLSFGIDSCTGGFVGASWAGEIVAGIREEEC
ncbi:hypothetical protein J2Z49_002316 [Desulfofundulus luciae]|uniref:Uncharacterized protein n=1 Tax=Desulfofundulus luciae TaxID=74702 RepID=A0ABU0B4K6_9FIRM|nr:hypothetical protein [Desulfofundulus luciae]